MPEVNMIWPKSIIISCCNSKSFDSGLPEPTTVYVHDGILHKSQFYSAVDFVLGKKQRGRGQR